MCFKAIPVATGQLRCNSYKSTHFKPSPLSIILTLQKKNGALLNIFKWFSPQGKRRCTNCLGWGLGWEDPWTPGAMCWAHHPFHWEACKRGGGEGELFRCPTSTGLLDGDKKEEKKKEGGRGMKNHTGDSSWIEGGLLLTPKKSPLCVCFMLNSGIQTESSHTYERIDKKLWQNCN